MRRIVNPFVAFLDNLKNLMYSKSYSHEKRTQALSIRTKEGSEAVTAIMEETNVPAKKVARPVIAAKAKQPITVRGALSQQGSVQLKAVTMAVQRAPTDPQTVLLHCKKAAKRFPFSAVKK